MLYSHLFTGDPPCKGHNWLWRKLSSNQSQALKGTIKVSIIMNSSTFYCLIIHVYMYMYKRLLVNLQMKYSYNVRILQSLCFSHLCFSPFSWSRLSDKYIIFYHPFWFSHSLYSVTHVYKCTFILPYCILAPECCKHCRLVRIRMWRDQLVRAVVCQLDHWEATIPLHTVCVQGHTQGITVSGKGHGRHMYM